MNLKLLHQNILNLYKYVTKSGNNHYMQIYAQKFQLCKIILQIWNLNTMNRNYVKFSYNSSHIKK